jgi:hypothetical protein
MKQGGNLPDTPPLSAAGADRVGAMRLVLFVFFYIFEGAAPASVYSPSHE